MKALEWSQLWPSIFRQSREDYYVVGGGVGAVGLKLIQAFMVVFVTCKKDEDQSKKWTHYSAHNISPIISLWEFFQTFKGS